MMNSISFGSTYKINHQANYPNQIAVSDFCDKNNLDCDVKTEVVKRPHHNVNYFSTSTIVASDDKDSLIESFLANKGIKFKKLTTEDLMKSSKVRLRINDAPKNMQLVNVDAKKLEKLIYDQETNIPHCYSDYLKYFKSDVQHTIKSGDKMNATSLFIIPNGESTVDTVKYIKKFGKDNLNAGQLSVYFNQSNDNPPDQCMFFGFDDLGMDKIPVYVEKDTYLIGKALDIFE